MIALKVSCPISRHRARNKRIREKEGNVLRKILFGCGDGGDGCVWGAIVTVFPKPPAVEQNGLN